MKRLLSIVTAGVMMTGCIAPTQTKVIQDGFMAQQKTIGEHRQLVEAADVYYSECRYDQLMLHKADNRYYCPPKATKDAYETQPGRPVIAQAVIERYLGPVLGAAAVFGGAAIIAGGMKGTTVNQANTTNVQPDAVISTQNLGVKYVPVSK